MSCKIYMTDRNICRKSKYKNVTYKLEKIENEKIIKREYRDTNFFFLHWTGIEDDHNIDTENILKVDVDCVLKESKLPKPNSKPAIFEYNNETVKNPEIRNKSIELKKCVKCKSETDYIDCENSKVMIIKFMEDPAPLFTTGIFEIWNIKFKLLKIKEGKEELISDSLAKFDIKLPFGQHSPNRYVKKKDRINKSDNDDNDDNNDNDDDNNNENKSNRKRKLNQVSKNKSKSSENKKTKKKKN